jgi:hypothetical protein
VKKIGHLAARVTGATLIRPRMAAAPSIDPSTTTPNKAETRIGTQVRNNSVIHGDADDWIICLDSPSRHVLDCHGR